MHAEARMQSLIHTKMRTHTHTYTHTRANTYRHTDTSSHTRFCTLPGLHSFHLDIPHIYIEPYDFAYALNLADSHTLTYRCTRTHAYTRTGNLDWVLVTYESRVDCCGQIFPHDFIIASTKRSADRNYSLIDGCYIFINLILGVVPGACLLSIESRTIDNIVGNIDSCR